jgi:hypothetical protein
LKKLNIKIDVYRIHPFWKIITAAVLFASRCEPLPERKEEKTANLQQQRGAAPGKPPSSFPDTLTIHFSAAVFYEPDSLQLLQLRAITDSGEFAAILHEYEFQIKTSIAYFAKYKPSIPMIHAKKVRFLQFIQTNDQDTLIDLDKNGDAYGLYLFRRNSYAYKVDMTNIDTEVPSYFDE